MAVRWNSVQIRPMAIRKTKTAPGFDHPDDEALADSLCKVAVHQFSAGHAPEAAGGPP
jgi:hypothetical protein